MQKGILGLGAMLQGQDQQLAGAGSAGGQPEGDEGPSPAQVIAGLWLQLSQLCWCPVLTEPPDAALPWRDGSSSSSSAASGAGSVSSSSGEAAGALRPQRLAAPCAVRPLRDLWLASAVKAVVDGECHSQVALSGLGW
jgi:sacsin